MNTHLKSVEDTDDNAALIRGKIIGASIDVEHKLDFILTKYYKAQNRPEFKPTRESWNDKIELIEKICLEKSIDEKVLFDRIKAVKKLRNAVAHRQQLYTFDDDVLNEDKIEFHQSGRDSVFYSPERINEFQMECKEISSLLMKLCIRILK